MGICKQTFITIFYNISSTKIVHILWKCVKFIEIDKGKIIIIKKNEIKFIVQLVIVCIIFSISYNVHTPLVN